jgi:hypothetical protein
MFEERALPSVSFLTISAASITSTVRYAEQGSSATFNPLSQQANASRYSEQGFGLVPLWVNHNGSVTFMIVNMASQQRPTADAITRAPVSQRESASATRDDTADTLSTTSNVAKNSARTASSNANSLIAFNPDATPANAWRAAPQHGPNADPRVTLAPNVPLPTGPTTPTAAILRDYSTITGVDIPAPGPQPPVPSTEASEPDRIPTPPATEPEATPPSITVDERPSAPLTGMLPFNLADLEAEAKNLLYRVGNFGTALVEEITESSEATWLTAAAFVAGGALIATRPKRPLTMNAPTGALFVWEDNDDNRTR